MPARGADMQIAVQLFCHIARVFHGHNGVVIGANQLNTVACHAGDGGEVYVAAINIGINIKAVDFGQRGNALAKGRHQLNSFAT